MHVNSIVAELGAPVGERFCAYCSGFLGTMGEVEPWNAVLMETENFVVVPSLGSIVEGWSLVVSKRHELCFGSISLEHSAEVYDILSALRVAMREEYNIEPTVFEHGPARQQSPLGCGIDHAHLHVVPLHSPLSGSRLIRGQKWFEVGADFLRGLKLYSGKGLEYLLLCEADSLPTVCLPRAVSSQLFRRAIAELVRVPEKFDYNRFPFRENCLATATRLGNRMRGVHAS